MQAGIDSLSAVEFRGKISSEFRSVRLPSTLMFDHPTLKATAAFVASQFEPKGLSVEEVSAKSMNGLKRHAKQDAKQDAKHQVAIEISGAACTLPGSSSFSSFACSLCYGMDAVVEMPYSRWDVGEYYAEEGDNTTMYVHHAAFLAKAELFDAQLFSLSKMEVDAMDPQQRLLLEASFAALVDSTGGTANSRSFLGKAGGVFVGQDKCDWNRMISAAHAGPFAATGGSASISSNRISYSLGLKGPSMTIDTACSSSLVACNTAAFNLTHCDFAVVCGVNMLLLPQTFIACCQARMLSSTGRCHTFDATACGYARGEGCGAQVLSSNSTSNASLSRFLGSALNQDGRSANLTSPNGPSQEQVIRSALQDAALSPSQLSQVETHGTGTELGDPIETGALRSVLPRVRLGAVKTNVGHLEGGAGMVGLSKLARHSDSSLIFLNLLKS